MSTAGHMVDCKKLPTDFPTHRHSAEFWQGLGRTVATFGFLEEVLGKAIFAFTATYEPKDSEVAYKVWLLKLERALSDQLPMLADSYQKAIRDNPDATINIDQLVEEIKKAAVVRNVLCHGSWRSPNANGQTVPLFVNRKMQVFDTPVDVAYLRQVQLHVAELACNVIDTVTIMGWQFPGSGGPGVEL
jgi:hypothetical protein